MKGGSRLGDASELAGIADGHYNSRMSLGEQNTSRRRVLCAIGTRPEAIKLAPVIHALRATDWADVRVLATGQHREMLAQMLAFF